MICAWAWAHATLAVQHLLRVKHLYRAFNVIRKSNNALSVDDIQFPQQLQGNLL